MLCNGLRNRGTLSTLVVLTILWQSIFAAAYAGTVQGKYHPGHYIVVNRSEAPEKYFPIAVQPGVAGLIRRYYWRELEPNLGVYDFSAIANDLAEADKNNVQLIVIVADKSYNSDKPMPLYLQSGEYMAPNRKNGYTSLRWKSYVVNRYALLVKALGSKFDSHPRFEGIATEESSLSINDSILNANGYTAESYRDALIDMLLASASSMPNSRIFWYMNYLSRNQGYIRDVANAVAPAGVVMGGPDITPDDATLVQMAYPFYDEFAGKMPLFGSVMYPSYSHAHKSTGYSTKYWTMPELFSYGKNNLNLNYMFWSRITIPKYFDSYTVDDAYPVIAKNPVFNSTWNGSALDTDGDGLTDAKEMSLGTDPLKKDTDGDGLSDSKELSLGTNPLKADTDGGGVDDKTEVASGTDPLKAWDDVGTAKDSDGDGLTDLREVTIGTDPLQVDTDRDGLNDGKEVQLYATKPLIADTDADFLYDGAEITFGTKPLVPDTDWDGLVDGREVHTLGTSPLKKDTDGGGVDDNTEIKSGTNPLKAWDDVPV